MPLAVASRARTLHDMRREVGRAAGHAVGETIDRAVMRHYARRLRKNGWDAGARRQTSSTGLMARFRPGREMPWRC